MVLQRDDLMDELSSPKAKKHSPKASPQHD